MVEPPHSCGGAWPGAKARLGYGTLSATLKRRSPAEGTGAPTRFDRRRGDDLIEFEQTHRVPHLLGKRLLTAVVARARHRRRRPKRGEKNPHRCSGKNRVRAVGQVDSAAMLLYNSPAHPQPEAGAMFPFCGEEGLEKFG